MSAAEHEHNGLCTHDYCVHDPSAYERREPVPDLVILVTGSRDWPEEHALAIEQGISDQILTANATDPLLIHGGCPTGVDAIADAFGRALATADELGPALREPEAWPADWEHEGKAAGPRRNALMVERAEQFRIAGADVIVLGYPWGPSRGTRGCLRSARERGLTTIVVEGADAIGRPHPEARGRGWRR